MKIKTEAALVLAVSEIPALDPLIIVMQDLGPNQGGIIVQCYGKAWAAYWGVMGSKNVAQFVASIDPSYLVHRLSPGKLRKIDEEYLHRVASATIEACKMATADMNFSPSA